MKSTLKRIKFKSETLGRTIDIIELSAAGQAALIDATAAGETATKIAARTLVSCVPEFKNETVDELMENLTMRTISELARAIGELSGVEAEDVKNSEAGPAADLSSGSRSH